MPLEQMPISSPDSTNIPSITLPPITQEVLDRVWILLMSKNKRSRRGRGPKWKERKIKRDADKKRERDDEGGANTPDPSLVTPEDQN